MSYSNGTAASGDVNTYKGEVLSALGVSCPYSIDPLYYTTVNGHGSGTYFDISVKRTGSVESPTHWTDVSFDGKIFRLPGIFVQFLQDIDNVLSSGIDEVMPKRTSQELCAFISFIETVVFNNREITKEDDDKEAQLASDLIREHLRDVTITNGKVTASKIESLISVHAFLNDELRMKEHKRDSANPEILESTDVPHIEVQYRNHSIVFSASINQVHQSTPRLKEIIKETNQEKDNAISRLEEANQDKDDEIRRLEEANQEKEGLISRLRETNQEKDDAIHRHEKDNQERSRGREVLSFDMRSKKRMSGDKDASQKRAKYSEESEQAKAELKAQQDAQAKAELKAQQDAQAKAELKAQQDAQAKAELKAQQDAQAKAELKAQQDAQAKAELKAQQDDPLQGERAKWPWNEKTMKSNFIRNKFFNKCCLEDPDHDREPMIDLLITHNDSSFFTMSVLKSNQRITVLQYSSDVGDFREGEPCTNLRNMKTYLKAAKKNNDKKSD